ncbi:chitin-binding, domain 3 [Dactylonectria estremocensis]|uniref:Chitin-binding, domain 3 n=1 Tax=Dactylonectria estremocensis TaxID=1079267 RepID=A0A9P9JA90_9HYPO|nr:chitin-binding, domain 3 [Dactylonectria estremocensis]
MFTNTILLAGLASVASAHMLISNPVPYGKSSLSNSPLAADGSDFPCKLRTGVYEAEGASNSYAQGSTQTLSFLGTAVHGGGSCQISITTDKEPTSSSVWKVIKSIEGGCPAKGQEGNIGDDANAEDPYTYDYTIPKELAAGDYTIAWTWFNKVGNREMYMNCAPLTVTGDGGDEGHLDTLPDMFVANIGNGCSVAADHDVQFPNPGNDVDMFNGNTEAWITPDGTGCQAGSGDVVATSVQATSAAAAPTTAAPATTAAPGNGNDGSTATASIPGGVFLTVSDEPAATTAAPIVSTPVTTEAPVATTAPASGDDSSDDSSSGESFTAGTACTSEGEWNCIGGSSFQRCASGAWTAAQALSNGVTCTPGQSTDIALSAKRGMAKMRRALRIRG